jgi:hypothetical protein
MHDVQMWVMWMMPKTFSNIVKHTRAFKGQTPMRFLECRC